MKKIQLTQGKYAIVDDEDYEIVSKFKWHYIDAYTHRKNGYARHLLYENGKPVGFIRMHHLILPFKNGYMIDHINGDGLDNRRENLRLVTKSQNMINSGARKNNTTGYKGVYRMRDKWRVSISRDRKQHHIGCFKDKLEAIKAYNEAAKTYHGEYAKLNVIGAHGVGLKQT